MGKILEVSFRDGQDDGISLSVAKFLFEVFPGYEWVVNTDKGVTKIWNKTLSNVWGVQLLTGKLSKRLVLESCGELLDRFNAPSKYNQDMIDSLEVDFTGRLKVDRSTKDERYKDKRTGEYKNYAG